MLGAPDDLLFYFEVDPLGEAFQMDGSARAWTDAGVEEEVIPFFCLFEADFALGFFIVVGGFSGLGWFFLCRVVFHDISAGVDSGFIFPVGGVDFAVDTGFADEELDPSQFDDLTGFELVAQIFTIFLFEFADDEVGLLLGFDVAGVGLVGVESLVFVVFFLWVAVGVWVEVEFDFLVSYWNGRELGEELELLCLIFIGFGLVDGHYLKTYTITNRSTISFAINGDVLRSHGEIESHRTHLRRLVVE